MAPLKLVNNTGLKSEANLCYVNSSLQLLNIIPEIKDLFVSTAYKKSKTKKLPISDELSRILSTDGRFLVSAAQLRFLAGTSSEKTYFNDGSQQDMFEFLQTLLVELEKELEMVSPDAIRILKQFYGREQITRKFQTTKEGFCNNCKAFPNKRSESFNIVKINPIDTQNVLSLDRLVQNKYTEAAGTLMMKCSNCMSSKSRES